MAHGAGRVKRTVWRRPTPPKGAGSPSILPAVLRRLALGLAVLALLLVLGAGPTLRPELTRDTVRSGVRADAGGTPAPAPPAAPACPPAGFSRLNGGHIRMPAGATPGATRLLLAIMSGADGDADDNLKLGG